MLIPFDHLFAKYRIKSTGVLHLGSNDGAEAEAYFKQGIKEVIWVEALPDLIPRLKEHVADYAQMKSTVLQACVSDVSGQEVAFNVTSNGGQSSSFLELGTHKTEHPSVRVVKQIPLTTWRVDDLLEHHNLHIGPGWFLNADLQGAELLALKGMGDLLREFDWAYVEVNREFLYKQCPLVEEIDAYLAKFGFTAMVTKWTGNGWGDRLYKQA